ncbi:MAG: ATP-binding cassette domain-containing protein, partial [Leeuwenhoekiella sp.]
MSITAKNITKTYGNQKALDDISFTIEKGEITGFLGPNGAGKSTMMKILTTYLSPTSGTSLINGFSTENEKIAVQKSIGYLPENNPLYLDMYIREYLKFNADIYKIDKNRIEEVIELTGITPEVQKKIG